MGCSTSEKRRGGTGGRTAGCKGVESTLLRTHLLVVSWWWHWKLDFTEVYPLLPCASSWGGCGPNLHPQLSSSPPPSLPPLICYSSTFLARVVSARDVVPMASAGVSRRFLPRMRSRALFSTLENSSYRPQSWWKFYWWVGCLGLAIQLGGGPLKTHVTYSDL